MNLNYSVIILIAAVLIILEILHEITGFFFKILFLTAKILIVCLEYVALYRIWTENGLFVKIALPLSFLGFLLLQILLFRKCKEKSPLRRAVISSIIIGTPIFSFVVTYLIAQLFQIEIGIMTDVIDLFPIFHETGRNL